MHKDFKFSFLPKYRKGWKGMAKEDRKKKGRWKWPCPENQLIRFHYDLRVRRKSFNIAVCDAANMSWCGYMQIIEKGRRGDGGLIFFQVWSSFWRFGDFHGEIIKFFGNLRFLSFLVFWCHFVGDTKGFEKFWFFECDDSIFVCIKIFFAGLWMFGEFRKFWYHVTEFLKLQKSFEVFRGKI